jgi:uncharacterized protein
MSLKARLQQDMQAALRAGDKARLGVLRMALAAVKQREVDTRRPLDDAGVQGVLEKMIKQGRDAQAQYEAGARADLAEQGSRGDRGPPDLPARASERSRAR